MGEEPRPILTATELARAADATPGSQLLTTGGSLACSLHECLDSEWLAGFLTAVRPVLPGYELLEEVGHGGMGVVHRARDLTFGRDVAVKLTHPGHGSDSAAARFRGESRITGRLQHPGIPPAYQAGECADGRPYLVMKLVAGRTLEALRAESTSALNVLAVFEQVAQAVGYAHAHGVIHRDLKPSNVMVGAFGEVQVMDWGLAKEIGAPDAAGGPEGADATGADESPATRPGGVVGTPAYMPPEQAAGAAVDARSDVFALGGVLCFLLTGRPPYSGPSAEAIQRAATGRTEEALARLDACSAEPGLVALAKRCLAADPAARPADGRAVAAEVAGLRAAAEERAKRAELERAQAEVRAAEQRKRRRVQLALAGSVLALLILAGGGLWWSDRQAAERASERRVTAARNREALAVALDQAEVGLRKPNPAYGEIDAALAQAEHRLRGEGATDADRGRYEELARARRLLSRLDEIDERRWLASEGKNHGDYEYAREQYPIALCEYGIVIGGSPAEALTEQVRRSPVVARLMAVLDLWLSLGEGTEALELINVLDPVPERVALRQAYARADVAAITRGVAHLDGGSLPASFAQMIGGHRLTPQPSAFPILAAAQAAHPDIFGLAMLTGLRVPDGRAEQQITYYRVALAIRPLNAIAHYNLGTALHKQKNLGAAITAYREAIRLSPKLAPAFSSLGVALSDRKDLVGAVAAYREAIRLQPTFPDAHNNLGIALREQGDLSGAIAAFREAVRLDTHLAPAYGNLARALREMKDFAGAAAAFREVVRLTPADAEAHNNLGVTLYKLGDLDGAIAAYREAIRLNLKYASAHTNLGHALHLRKDLAGAVAAYREAIRVDPGYALAYTRLGNALFELGDLAGTLAAMKEAVRLKDDFPSTYMALAALIADNDPAGAFQVLRDGAKHYPGWMDDLQTGYRSLSARIAVRLSRFEDQRAPTVLRRTALRQVALIWLRADLAAWQSSLTKSMTVRSAAHQAAETWLHGGWLAPVREPDELAELSADERGAWEQFWADVRCLRDATDPRRELLPPPRDQAGSR
jgi:tetratricopeptide (TPR) repeat protein